jgi:phosphomevalonate kinase
LENNLDFVKLSDSSSYKEEHRKSMILWGEAKRKQDPGFFCRAAIENRVTSGAAPVDVKLAFVWVVSDARRQTDLDFFRYAFPEQLVRSCPREEQD